MATVLHQYFYPCRKKLRCVEECLTSFRMGTKSCITMQGLGTSNYAHWLSVRKCGVFCLSRLVCLRCGEHNLNKYCVMIYGSILLLFSSFLPCDAMRKRGHCCRPLSSPVVRPSVTLVYCIQTAENIVRLFSRPDSPRIQFFDPERRYPIPRGTSSVGAQNTRGGKIGDFRLESPSISETVRDRPMVAIKH